MSGLLALVRVHQETRCLPPVPPLPSYVSLAGLAQLVMAMVMVIGMTLSLRSCGSVSTLRPCFEWSLSGTLLSPDDIYDIINVLRVNYAHGDAVTIFNSV